MKKPIIYLLGALMASTVLFSCETEDDGQPEDESGSGGSSGSKVTSIIYTETGESAVTYIPEYDSEGRITKTFGLFGMEIVRTYDATTMTEEVSFDGDSEGVETFTVNDDGFPVTGTDAEGDDLTFTYDDEGKLLYFSDIAKDGSADIFDTVFYVNGSLSKVISDQTYPTNTARASYDFTVSSLDAKGPALVHYQNWMFLFGGVEWGNHGTKLIAGNDDEEYTFEVDSNGNLTKLIADGYTVEFKF